LYECLKSMSDDELEDVALHSWPNPNERSKDPDFVRKWEEMIMEESLAAYPNKNEYCINRFIRSIQK
jgi:hypothetical protein